MIYILILKWSRWHDCWE